MKKLVFKLILLGLLCEAALQAHAAIFEWTGAGGGGNLNLWSSKNNWDSEGVLAGAPPTGSDDAVFGTLVTGSVVPTLTANSIIQSITFSGARSFNIQGGLSLTVNNGVFNNSSAIQTFSAATMILGGSQTWNANTGNLTVSSALDNNGHLLTVNDGGAARTTTLTGAISGSGGLVMNGSGTTVLGGANTYTGATAVNAGTLAANLPSSLGSATTHTSGLDISGGTVQLNASPSASNIPLTLSGTGVLQINNHDSGWGLLTLASGSPHLDLSPGDSGKATTFSGATFTSGTLTVDHWAEVANRDQIFITGAINGSLLANVNFSGFGTGSKLVGNELVPFSAAVPEPQTYAVCFGVALLVYGGYRRRTSSARSLN